MSQKIILNNGKYEKLDKKELNNNLHTKALLLDLWKNFYDVSIKNINFTRIEIDDFPKIPYYEVNGNILRTTRHFGQRKLLLSEIEFLTIMYNKYNLMKYDKVILLYVGAAPGYHIPILINLFPNLYCHLYDPQPFTINNKYHIKIIQDFFTNKDVDKYYKKTLKNKKILFISDIRDPFYDKERVDQLQNDMRLQQKWAIDIKPLGAMFKFRLLFDDNNTKYLIGDSYLPVWGRLTTTETRLICNKDDTNNWTKFKLYNNKDHEQRMFYFNNCYRMSLFNHNVHNVPGICHCYDCTSEVVIVFNYLNLMKKYNITVNLNNDNVYKLNSKFKITNNIIGDFMNYNSKICHYNLNDPNVSYEERLKNMKKRKDRAILLKNKKYYNNYLKNN